MMFVPLPSKHIFTLTRWAMVALVSSLLLPGQAAAQTCNRPTTCALWQKMQWNDGASTFDCVDNSAAVSMGLDAAVWPDYIVCIDSASTYRLYTLQGVSPSSGLIGYHHPNSAGEVQAIWFSLAAHSYAGGNGTVIGDCAGKNIATLRSDGRAKYY